jgi:G3E family GTPase
MRASLRSANSQIIQTFYLEDELARSLRLDGVVTLVDAKHCHLHLDHPTKGTSQASHEQEQRQGQQEDPLAPDNEAVAQIAYSDRIILNKADLVGSEQLNSALSRVRSINALASVQTAEHAQVDADYVLGVGGFNLDRVVNQVDSLLLEGDSAQSHEHAHHSSDKTHEHHDHYHDEHEHHHHHHHDHSHGVHNDAVTSVALTMDGEVDIDLVNDWLGALLEDNWQNIYRMKGVLAIEGCDERYVFQGVHSLFEGTPEQNWGENEKRANKLVLIGQDLPPREELEEAFRDCLAVEE